MYQSRPVSKNNQKEKTFKKIQLTFFSFSFLLFYILDKKTPLSSLSLSTSSVALPLTSWMIHYGVLLHYDGAHGGDGCRAPAMLMTKYDVANWRLRHVANSRAMTTWGARRGWERRRRWGRGCWGERWGQPQQKKRKRKRKRRRRRRGRWRSARGRSFWVTFARCGQCHLQI